MALPQIFEADNLPEAPQYLDAVPVSAMEAQERALVDIQIATAKRYPRSVDRALKEAKDLVAMDQETAESCLYALRRRGDRGEVNIEGPSVRLAEIVLNTWGNMQAGARIIDEQEKFLVAQAVVHDLQRNVAVKMEVRRRITTKTGNRFSDDMIVTTANAACSIALRNAVFKAIPRSFVNQVYHHARQVAVGDARTFSSVCESCLSYFSKLGVGEQHVYDLLEIGGRNDLTQDHIAHLKGIANAIKEGEQTIEDAFPSLHEPVPSKPAPRERQRPAAHKADDTDDINYGEPPASPPAGAPEAEPASTTSGAPDAPAVATILKAFKPHKIGATQLSKYIEDKGMASSLSALTDDQRFAIIDGLEEIAAEINGA